MYRQAKAYTQLILSSAFQLHGNHRERGKKTGTEFMELYGHLYAVTDRVNVLIILNVVLVFRMDFQSYWTSLRGTQCLPYNRRKS